MSYEPVRFCESTWSFFSTVNRWETGKTLPTYKAMKNIEIFCAQYNLDFENFKEAWKEEK